MAARRSAHAPHGPQPYILIPSLHRRDTRNQRGCARFLLCIAVDPALARRGRERLRGTVRCLLSPAAAASEIAPRRPVLAAATAAAVTEPAKAGWRNKAPLLGIATILSLAIGSAALYHFVLNGRHPGAAAFSPPPHSIAVLPFVNMSGDKDQDYFSDGLTEELLNSLARINELQVAARTSAFSFKDKDIDVGTIGRQLNVASILEGSVRRSDTPCASRRSSSTPSVDFTFGLKPTTAI